MKVKTNSKVINRYRLQALLEKHFWNSLDASSFDIESFPAKRLMSFNRLDVAIKLIYLEAPSTEFANNLYSNHIKCFTLGKYEEPGNSLKNSLKRYYEEFEKVRTSIALNGFDSESSVIPVGKKGTILNGAHRIAAAMRYDKNVEIVKLPIDDSMYDYRFFLDRGMSIGNVEHAVSRFIELQENSFIACVWPKADGRDSELDALFSRVIYRKSITLSYGGAHNLLSSVYAGEPWLGAREKNFPGVEGKLTECFNGDGALRVIAFQAGSLEEVVLLKEKIRNIFRMGKHSVHITDTHAEAVRLSRLLFNENSLHFLEFGRPSAFEKTLPQIEQFKGFLDANLVNPSEVVLDSSVVLALYGLREAMDVDYLSTIDLQSQETGIDAHDSELRFHKLSKDDLIFNSEHFFYYEGLKFVSLPQLAAMKRNRGEKKDENDLMLMAPLLTKSKGKSLAAIKERALFFRAKARRSLVQLLKNFRLYSIVRFVYRSARGKAND